MYILKEFDLLGLTKGDIILIHSNIVRLALLNKNPKEICEILLNCLKEKVGNDGTLLFPTFNFDFCSGSPFSIKGTESEMGSLTEYALFHPEAKRTRHPVFNFAVIGKLAEYFSKIDNKGAFSDESIFGELKRRRGKIMIIDLSYTNSLTFIHHIEEMAKVDYRYHKDFTGFYIDEDNQTSEKTYSQFVRNLEMGVVNNIDPAGEMFEKAGYVRKVVFKNGAFIKVLNAMELFNFISGKLKENPALLYRIQK